MGEGLTDAADDNQSVRSQHAECEQQKSGTTAQGHRQPEWPDVRPPIAPVGDRPLRGPVRSELSHRKPQTKAQYYADTHARHAGSKRHTKGHEQRARPDDQHKPQQSGDAPGQHDEQCTNDGDHRGSGSGIRATFSTQIAAIRNHATRNNHARHVIRSIPACAVFVFIAARAGSELASHSTRFAHVAGRIDAFIAHVVGSPLLVRGAWWLVLGCCVVGLLTVGRRHSQWLTLLVVLTTAHGAVQWQRLSTPQTGEYSGVVFARSDPAMHRGATTLIVEVDGENFRLVARGRARNVLHHVRMGDALLVDASRTAYDARRLRFVAGKHVQGELRDVIVHATSPSIATWHLAANRVHEVVDRGSRVMDEHDAALVRGLVLGDESRQPGRMTTAFRESGLGHLLAVSGQNVVLLLAALTPALRRLGRWQRLTAALGVVALFALVTRLESSVVRAGVMAAVVQVGYAIGRDVMPLRALALTVITIVTIDPLATWSIGFVLSVAATAGLIAITPRLGASIFAATAAAQFAVAPFVIWWFGSMPSLALATNVLAVPVASCVMVAGPPVLAVAAFVPDTVAEVLALPIVAAVRWVWWVAEWGTRLAPSGWVNLVVWLAVIAFVVWRLVSGAS